MTKTKTQSKPISEEFILKLFDKLDKKTDFLGKKSDRLNKKIDLQGLQLRIMQLDIGLLKSKVDQLDDKVMRKFDKHLTHIDGLAKGFKKFEEELTILSQGYSDHDDRLEKLETKVFSIA